MIERSGRGLERLPSASTEAVLLAVGVEGYLIHAVGEWREEGVKLDVNGLSSDALRLQTHPSTVF